MRLLIVDDEKNTREGLLNHVAWKTLGVSDVKTAANGESAIRICAYQTPDIILSDIRMPGMDGIALCSYLRERFPNTQIIFLSGFSDNKYLKAAIDLDVVRYVEKPIDIKELEQAVKKAADRLKRNSRRAAFPPYFDEPGDLLRRNGVSELSGDLLRRNGVSELLNRESAKEYANGFSAAAPLDGRRVRAWHRVLIIKRSSAHDDGTAFMDAVAALANDALYEFSPQVAFRDARHCFVVISAEKKPELASKSRSMMRLSHMISEWNRDDERLFCAVGETVQGSDSLGQSAQNACHALRALYFQGYGHTNFYHEEQIPQISDVYIDPNLYAGFSHAVDIGDRSGALAILQELRARLASQERTMTSSVKNAYFKFALRLRNATEKDKQPNSDSDSDSSNNSNNNSSSRNSSSDSDSKYVWERFLEFETLEETHAYLRRQTEEQLALPKMAAAVAKSIHLIRKRYADETLSVKSLCKELFLSPAYFSGLFKRETGKTVGRYITEVRIERAKELLRDRRLKLYHVAVAVGYTDPSYFAKAFKRTVGVMPSEYRERHQL